MPGSVPRATSRATAPARPSAGDRLRVRLAVRGAVQGVGFRPFVHRLAHDLGLAGWVLNDGSGVLLEVEGPAETVERFGDRLPAEAPPAAVIQEIHRLALPTTGESGFRIAASLGAGPAKPSVVVLPDLVTCAACRRELFDPADRRFRYPFLNCTHCGPRFTIVLDLPYDRARTTMRGFAMCPACRAEYENPRDRRFHAQPVACPRCGPRLWIADATGRELATGDAALAAAVDALRGGRVVALKGLGGFQLLVDARDEPAVDRLRERKCRPTKPLALMVRDLDAARRWAEVSPGEASLLASREGPIVLLDRRAEGARPGDGRPRRDLAPSVAPGTSRLGVMLPTTPVHHLLLHDLETDGAPWAVVATSGNLAEEPIAIDNDEAVSRLGRVADLFLMHDRPIARPADDGVSWWRPECPGGTGEQPVRRARGAAPLPVLLRDDGPCVVATGAHQKDAAALACGRQVFLSQHLGDMETPQTLQAFDRAVLDLLRLYQATPAMVAHDLHPDYPTTRWALRASAGTAEGLLARSGGAPGGIRSVAVQHHHAHLAACLAERGREMAGPVLGLTWDGTGFGADGTVWGGEALWGDARSFERVARLRPFRLPGSERAVREPWRVALALVFEVERASANGPAGSGFFRRVRDRLAAAGCPLPVDDRELDVLGRMAERGFNAPWTSSLGRLFDGVSALLGIRPSTAVSFEGEAAIELEEAAAGAPADDDSRTSGLDDLGIRTVPAPAGTAPGQIERATIWEVDWRPLVAGLLAARAGGTDAGRLARAFHERLARAAAGLARLVAAEVGGPPAVALTGGCFQNRLLARRVGEELAAMGCEVMTHGVVPANDGGIALGQAAVARALARAGGSGSS